jgi:hypothetical protein
MFASLILTYIFVLFHIPRAPYPEGMNIQARGDSGGF